MRKSFRFRGQNCEEFGVILQSVQMPLLPEKRRNIVTIPGRDGTMDQSTETVYNDVEIELTCGFHGRGREEVRQKARAITEWLSKKGELEFSDEEGRFYDAEIVDGADLETSLLVGTFTLTFRCFPFAMSRPYVVEFDALDSNQIETLRVNGTVRTPCVLTLKNTGTTPIRGIQIGHKMEVQ